MSASAVPAARLLEERPGPAVHLDEWVAPEIADEHGYLRGSKISHRLALQRTLHA